MKIKEYVLKIRGIIVNDLFLAIKSKDPRTLKPIALFTSMVVDMGLMFISGIITARLLGPGNYGDLQFIKTIWGLLALIITIGYFQSGTRVLVLEKDPQKCREVSGTIVFLSFVMGAIICVVVAMLAYPLDYMFHTNVALAILVLAPFLIGLPLDSALPLILQGTSQIYVLAIYSCAPALLYIVTIIVLSKIHLISTTSVLITFQVTTLLVNLLILSYIKPTLKSIRYWWGEIRKRNKTYGFPVYRGSLIALGTGYLNRLVVSYWVDNTALGFFSLAGSLTDPLKFIPNAIATSSFRGFAREKGISKRILFSSIGITLVSLVLALIFYGTPLSWLYTSKFIEVSPMARVLSVGALFMGFGDLFNRFLGAHGQGKPLQNAAIIYGVTNVIGALIFVPRLGAWGAVITSILAGGVYLLQMVLSYRSYHRKISHPEFIEEPEFAKETELVKES